MGNPETPERPQPQGFPDDGAEREQVHFYPGDKVLLYLVEGKVKLNAEAWGGPLVKQPRELDESMAAGPTHAGTFVIDGIMPYSTKTWTWSKIPWGTRIRESKTRSNEVEYEQSPGKWRRVTDKHNVPITKRRIELRRADLYGLVEFPETWIFNDFGPLAVRYYRDRNKNRRRDANEPLEGEMIHTTHYNEAQSKRYPEDLSKVELDDSHGCIHIKPIDRDAFIDAAAFRQGMTLIIHRYSEHFAGEQGEKSR
jgi:hypothetical protein